MKTTRSYLKFLVFVLSVLFQQLAIAQTENGLLIGNGTLDANAILQIESTTQGFLMPVYGTSYNSATKSRASTVPAEAGMMFYDQNGQNIMLYDASTNVNSWKALGFFPIGGIVMWAGTTPPAGWVLCDGSNGTPDLRGRFVVGFQSTDVDYNTIGKTGGASAVILNANQLPSHSHTVNDPRHSHTATLSHTHSYAVTEFSSTSPANAKRNVGGGGSPSGSLEVTTSQSSFNATLTVAGVSVGASVGSTGGGQPHPNLPPYYVLAFIMRVN